FTLRPVISDDLLPTTTRNLVINDLTSLLALPLAQMFNNDPDDADHFAVSYWRFNGKVATWTEKYDKVVAEFVEELAKEGPATQAAWQADVDYLIARRPYMQFRFLQIAAAADDEQQRGLSCLEYLDQSDSVSKPQTHPELSRRPMARIYIPMANVTVSVTAQQLASFLESAEHKPGRKDWTGTLPVFVRLEPPSGKKALCSADLGVELPIPVVLEDPEKPGDLVDRLIIPLGIDWDALGGLDPLELKLPSALANLSTPQLDLLIKIAERLNAATENSAQKGRLEFLIHMLKSGLTPMEPAPRGVPPSQDKSQTPIGPERIPLPPPPARLQQLDRPRQFQAPYQPRPTMAAQYNAGPEKQTPVILRQLVEPDLLPLLMRRMQPTEYGNSISWVLDKTLSPAIDNIFDTGPVSIGAPVHSGTGPRPLVGSQILQVYGFDAFCRIAYETYTNLRTNAANRGVVHVYDINQYLAAETLSAYEFLSRKDNLALWSYATPQLAQAIDSRDYRQVFEIRQAFFNAVGGSAKHTITGALAWAIVVDAARLNHQLMQDMASLSQAKGCNCAPPHELPFVGPKELIPPEAHEYFKQYVLCRWPIITFSLDPVNEEQNVADVFSRRRDLQLAVAVAVASGNVSPSCAGAFTRRMELDMETIALNRTQVAFSYANDTFGWRFYPRVQSPDTPGTLGAIAQTLFGTANRDSDLKARQLEPGIRDCTAVVIMPSFVPYVDITTRADWFGVTNPR
ncbi:MAG TPA: hypothetical protein VGG64_21850, partial [Pirellulales bacterium]